MGHKHTKDEILDGALAAAFDDGTEPAHVRTRRQADRHQRSDRRLLLPDEGRPDQRGPDRDGDQAPADAGPGVRRAGRRPPRARPRGLADPRPPRRRPGLRPLLRSSGPRRHRPSAVPTRSCPSSSRPGSRGPPSSSTAGRHDVAPRPRRPSRSSTVCCCSASSPDPRWRTGRPDASGSDHPRPTSSAAARRPTTMSMATLTAPTRDPALRPVAAGARGARPDGGRPLQPRHLPATC